MTGWTRHRIKQVQRVLHSELLGSGVADGSGGDTKRQHYRPRQLQDARQQGAETDGDSMRVAKVNHDETTISPDADR